MRPYAMRHRHLERAGRLARILRRAGNGALQLGQRAAHLLQQAFAPASVSASRRVLRWNRRTPSRASSRATFLLTAAGVRPKRARGLGKAGAFGALQKGFEQVQWLHLIHLVESDTQYYQLVGMQCRGHTSSIPTQIRSKS